LNQLTTLATISFRNTNEAKSLENLARKCLSGISDNFFIVPLCKECWSKKISKQYENESKILQPKKPFEIID